MSTFAKTKIATLLHQAYRQNQMFPESLIGSMTLDEAYQVQLELADLREADGEQLSGWKVGLTSKAMQVQQGMFEPCLGHLLQSGQLNSSAQLDFDKLKFPGFENELCFRACFESS